MLAVFTFVLFPIAEFPLPILVLAVVLVVFVVDVGVAFTTTAVFEFIAFRFVLFALELLTAVFVFAAPPQAIPKAPSAKRLESAIIFLIKLLSFSKVNSNQLLYTALLQTQKFGTRVNIKFRVVLVNPKPTQNG